tara:strand:+ start:793 stop:1197 length:405 start_codon:yes stop_codon:yes gene_type:complete
MANILTRKILLYMADVPDFELKKHLKPSLNTGKYNIRLQDDGQGAYIQTWDEAKVGKVKPTAEQLDAFNAEAEEVDKVENSKGIAHGYRQQEYGNPNHQIENIIENGLEAEQARVQAIKDKYPLDGYRDYTPED